MPPHIFRTKFRGFVGTALRTSFARFSRARDLFSKATPVQAINVSTLASTQSVRALHHVGDGRTDKNTTRVYFVDRVHTLEAQQRHFSYRAILVAIVSQNIFVLVVMGYRTIIARSVAKWVSHRCACVKLSTRRGYRTMILGERYPPLKGIARYGVLQRCDMGPLRCTPRASYSAKGCVSAFQAPSNLLL